MAKTPEIGTLAPDFTLPALTLADGVAVRADKTLSAERGKPVVLAFYPGDGTAVCTKQLCGYTSDMDQFRELDAVVWGISPQSVDSHEEFARKFSLAMPLLADVRKEVVAAYGIGLFGIGLKRSVFVIDAEGVLRWKSVAAIGLSYPTADEIAAQVKAASTPRV